MIISRPMILTSLVIGTVAYFFHTSDTRVSKLRISFTIDNTHHYQLGSIISQPPPFALAARDEQTEDCRRFKTCGDN